MRTSKTTTNRIVEWHLLSCLFIQLATFFANGMHDAPLHMVAATGTWQPVTIIVIKSNGWEIVNVWHRWCFGLFVSLRLNRINISNGIALHYPYCSVANHVCDISVSLQSWTYVWFNIGCYSEWRKNGIRLNSICEEIQRTIRPNTMENEPRLFLPVKSRMKWTKRAARARNWSHDFFIFISFALQPHDPGSSPKLLCLASDIIGFFVQTADFEIWYAYTFDGVVP